MHTEICKMCGAEFESNFSNNKYCSEKCSSEARKLKYLEKHPLFVGNTVKCAYSKCQNEFTISRASSKYCCVECRKKANYEMQKAKLHQRRKKPKKPKLSLDDILRISRAEGLSYGEYVAKYGV